MLLFGLVVLVQSLFLLPLLTVSEIISVMVLA